MQARRAVFVLTSSLLIAASAWAQEVPGQAHTAPPPPADAPTIAPAPPVSSEGAQAHAMAPTKKALALTISGGISFGAWEAGVNWAIAGYARTHAQSVSLDVITGASAGNINAFLTALDLCGVQPPAAEEPAHPGASTDDPDADLTTSWYWQTWVPVGLQQDDSSGTVHVLMPPNVQSGKPGSGYLDDDGLFTRNAFDPILDLIRKGLAAPRSPSADAACSKLIGITLTRYPEAQTRLSGSAADRLGSASSRKDQTVPIPVTRFVAPMRFDRSTALKFRALSGAELDRVAERQGLVASPAAAANEFGVERAFDYILAASAFPYAFGAKRLTYFSNEDDFRGAGPSLNDGARWSGSGHDGVFLDGGIFDNIPVGLAGSLLALHRQTSPPGAAAACVPTVEDATYFFVDPDRRRLPDADVNAPIKVDEVPRSGLSELEAALPALVASARKAELEDMRRNPYAEDALHGDLVVSRRTTHVFGEYLGAFGAFADRRFREVDFLLGAVDGVFTLTDWLCLSGCPAGWTSTARTIFASLPDHDRAALADTFGWVLAAREGSTPPPLRVGKYDGKNVTLTGEQLAVALEVLSDPTDRDFGDVLASLSRDGRWAGGPAENYDEWLERNLSRAMLRGLELERREGGMKIRVFDLGNLFLRGSSRYRGRFNEQWAFDPSTIPTELDAAPGVLAAEILLPQNFDLTFPELGNIGLRANWFQPTFSFIPRAGSWGSLRIGAPLAGILVPGGGRGTFFEFAGLQVDYAPFAVAVPHVRASWVLPSSFNQANLVSLSVGVTVLDVIELGALRYPTADLSGHAWAVTLGWSNVKGSLYWLGRAAVGR